MFRAAFLLIPLSLLGAGCALPSKDDLASRAQDAVTKAAERGAEEITRRQIGKEVDIQMTGDGAVFRDPVSGRIIAIGEQVTIPDGFPSDVPVFPEATPTSAAMDPGAGSATLLVTTSASQYAMRDWYAAQAVALGWAAEGILETADRIILSFTRPDGSATAKLTVTILPPTLQKQVLVLVVRKGK